MLKYADVYIAVSEYSYEDAEKWSMYHSSGVEPFQEWVEESNTELDPITLQQQIRG